MVPLGDAPIGGRGLRGRNKLMLPFARPVLQLLSRGKLSVFLFHKVPVDLDPVAPQDIGLRKFEHLLDDVLNQFQIISLEDGVRGLQAGKLPARAACITFDDGYVDWLPGMAPALERRNMHATLFITAGQFDGRPLWHERIAGAVRALRQPTLDLQYPAIPPIDVSSLPARQAAVVLLESKLKYLTLEVREELLLRMEAQAGVSAAQVPRMSADQLRELHARGFSIGAHTYDHPILDYCDQDRALQEIGGVREILEGMIGAPVRTFAYPNGRPYVDFSSHHVAMVKRAGYASAVTTQWGTAEIGSSVYQIPRFTPWGKDPLRFMLQLGRNMMTAPERVPEEAP